MLLRCSFIFFSLSFLQAGSVAEYEEAVCVERTGECLVVHFKCPCGKGYQILLSGRECYYKLI